MAVASENGTGTGTRTETPLSKLDSSDASKTFYAADAGGADGFDRSDSANSSPNPQRDAEIQSPDVLKSEEYRQLFRLPPEEVLIEDFNCALQENILIQGHMYLFIHFICFYSNIFGFETKRIIPFHEVTSVRRAKTAGIFHNAIEILAGGKKHFFASFLSRDEAFKIIDDLCSQHGDNSRAVIERQDTIPESSSQRNGSIATENARNSNGLDSELLSSDVSRDTTACQAAGPLSNVGDGLALITVSEQPSSVTHVAEPVSSNDDSKVTLDLKEDIDAPKISEDYTHVAESKFQIRAEDFYKYFSLMTLLIFWSFFHERSGDKDFKCSSWKPQEKGYTREMSFQHPIKLYLGAKFGGCHEVQKFQVYRNSHLVIKTTQEVSDVPYADYFCVEGLWDIERGPDESKECCILRVYVNVAFSKKTIWKGKIVQSTVEECREAYTTWINMAHELLKQKHLEKQEVSVATTSGTQNGEVYSDVEAKTLEFSERSQEPCNPSRARVTSDSIDVNQHVGNHLHGNFIDTSSIPPLLREFMTKFRTSLRSQSHPTLLLVIIFAMIFFMQFSILVLLSRPQHIHVSPPADYMTKIENGMTRSSSQDIAWLEKRIHHLRDEMYMVETRLERMRYEHALLKNQLKDIERQ